MPKTDSHIDSFVLKIVAILGMTANHVAHAMGSMMPWPATLVLYSFGGVTYPVMAYLLVIGYMHTSNVRRYASRLFLFALASQVPFTLCLGWGSLPIPRLNVLFTLLIGLGLLWAWDNVALRDFGWGCLDGARLEGSKIVSSGSPSAPGIALFVLVLAAGVAASYFCDWAISGPLLVVLFHMLRGKGGWGIVITMTLLYLYVLVPNVMGLFDQVPRGMVSAQNAIDQNLQHNIDMLYVAGVPIHLYNVLLQTIANIGYAVVGFTIATVLVCRYNGRRGLPMKWFFYAYYPLHLLAIWALDEVLTAL